MVRENDLWQQEAKRVGGEAFTTIIVELRDGQQRILERLDQMDDRHIASEQAIATMIKAFPEGDVEGHRRYHATMIEMLEERRRLRRAITEKTISGLLWAGIVFMGAAVWHYVRTKTGG